MCLTQIFSTINQKTIFSDENNTTVFYQNFPQLRRKAKIISKLISKEIQFLFYETRLQSKKTFHTNYKSVLKDNRK